MVEPVMNSIGRLRPSRLAEDEATPVGRAAAGAAVRPAGTGADAVDLSATATAGLPQELRAGPPMDLEIVKRIRDAIAEGKYPIDIDKITEAMFASFREMAG